MFSRVLGSGVPVIEITSDAGTSAEVDVGACVKVGTGKELVQGVPPLLVDLKHPCCWFLRWYSQWQEHISRLCLVM